MECSEHEIPVPWGIVAGKWWGSKHRQPILCLHGWQDNAGTFDRLIPLLPNTHSYLSLDMPGHGKSSHYPPGMQYYINWDGITLIRRIVKYYKWKNVILMGQSIGGYLSFMYAASFPDEVQKLICIDISGPTRYSFKYLLDNLGGQIDKFLESDNQISNNKGEQSKQIGFQYDKILAMTEYGYEGSIDKEGAKIMIKRGTSVTSNGQYQFNTDTRLRYFIPGMVPLETVLAFAKKVKCEVLNIKGIPGITYADANTYPAVIKELKQSAKRLVYEEISGTHHLHLVTPEKIAGIIEDFLV